MKSERFKEIVEKTEKHDKAIKTLKDLGVFCPFNLSVLTFHGRVNTDGKIFEVQENFENSGYTNGHYNLNAVPGLHTTSFEIVKKYAKTRTYDWNKKLESVKEEEGETFSQKRGKVEVQRIVPKKDGLIVFDILRVSDPEDIFFGIENGYLKLSKKEVEEFLKGCLNEQEREEFKQAMKNLVSCYDFKEMVPELFKNSFSKKALKDFEKICDRNKLTDGKGFVFDLDLEDYLKDFENEEDKENLSKIASNLNTEKLIEDGKLGLLMSKKQSNIDFVEDLTIGFEFLDEFLKRENIVGVHQKIWHSKVIDENNFDEYFFFDTSNLNTEEVWTENTNKNEENFLR